MLGLDGSGLLGAHLGAMPLPGFRVKHGIDVKNGQFPEFFVGISQRPAGLVVDFQNPTHFVNTEDADRRMINAELRSSPGIFGLGTFSDA